MIEIDADTDLSPDGTLALNEPELISFDGDDDNFGGENIMHPSLRTVDGKQL